MATARDKERTNGVDMEKRIYDHEARTAKEFLYRLSPEGAPLRNPLGD